MAKKEEKNTKKEETKKSGKDFVHEIVIKVEGDEWKKAIDETFKKKQKNLSIDGFRKGKVPRSVYEKKFGKESLFLDAADSLVQMAYMKALTESKLVPAVQPSVDLKSIDEKGVEFKFTIITKPEVKVKKYSGLKVEEEKVEVTKEEIDHEISHILEHYAEMATKDGKVENGDIAIIDFEGFKDGEAFDGGKGENYSLEIGSNTFIPGFEEGVIGMKAEDEKDIELTFPEDYAAKELAGQKVTFKVKVNEVKTKVERTLDEDFFEDLGMKDVTNEKELRDSIKKSLEDRKKYEAENVYLEKLLEEVSKNVEVDIPEEMVSEEVEGLKHRMEHEMSHQGLTLDMYYQFTGTTEEDLNAQLEKEAYKNVLYRLMLEEIRTLEKIEATDKEMNDEADKLAERYQAPKEEILAQMGGLEALRYDVEMNKTIDKLKELNKA
ncbi:MAG: trigger factor [Bacilli bacterium]|nr:trigger factor [Bacilli bacterium]